MTDTLLTAPEIVNFLTAKAVASATAYLEGRSDAARLEAEADRLMFDMFAAPHHPAATSLSDPSRMLVIAMKRLARATEAWRVERWQMIVAALVELVRRESTELRLSGAQRS